MDDESATPYLCVSGLSIYTDIPSRMTGILPVTVEISIGSHSYQFQSGTTVSSGAYSPSGSRMNYYAMITSTEPMMLDVESAVFEIGVTATAADGTVLQFTEEAHLPARNAITCPSMMYTGRAYEFLLQQTVQAGTKYRSAATLRWAPQIEGVYTTQVYEEGYTDPYTRVKNATEGFSSVWFAVPNYDNLEAASGMTSDAQLVFSTFYLSEAFTNGCVITELNADVPVSPRAETDSELAPVITGVDVTVAPQEAMVNGKYVHGKALVTFTPVAQYKYGDSASYLHTEAGDRYAASVSVTAEGVAPGTEYVRPDTGETVTADDTTVRGISISVSGRKWRMQSEAYTSYYQVLYYRSPRVTSFNVYRMSVSNIATDYLYNNVYYKKDDFGAYGMAEFTVDFSSLDGENEAAMTIQYGTHRIPVIPDENGHGIVVFPANTAITVDVVIVLYDSFMPYGVDAVRRLSTGMILMEYLAGGTGMSIGKAATEPKALDIASDWKLLFFQATVGAYDGDAEEDLVAWMHNVDARLTALEEDSTANY